MKTKRSKVKVRLGYIGKIVPQKKRGKFKILKNSLKHGLSRQKYNINYLRNHT